MKSLKLIVIGIMLFLASTVKAQVTDSVYIGTAPPWGPAGYSEASYYYLPDVEAYYEIQTTMFIYQVKGVWVRRPFLSKLFRSYDLYRGYKVVMNENQGDASNNSFAYYKTKYPIGYCGGEQKTIGQLPEKGQSIAVMYAIDKANKKKSQTEEKGNDIVNSSR